MKNSSELHEGQNILFDDKKYPLKVENLEEKVAELKGPRGGKYYLKFQDGTPLLSSGRSFDYAEKVTSLREAGEWTKKEEGIWIHSKTEKTVKLKNKRNGFWTIETELEYEPPKYGFTSRSEALSKAKCIIEENPEGQTYSGR